MCYQYRDDSGTYFFKQKYILLKNLLSEFKKE